MGTNLGNFLATFICDKFLSFSHFPMFPLSTQKFHCSQCLFYCAQGQTYSFFISYTSADDSIANTMNGKPFSLTCQNVSSNVWQINTVSAPDFLLCKITKTQRFKFKTIRESRENTFLFIYYKKIICLVFYLNRPASFVNFLQ